MGTKTKTGSGLKKTDLMKNKNGKIVSRKASAHGKKAYGHIKGWTVAVTKARKFLGLKGFIAVKKGSPLYIRRRSSTASEHLVCVVPAGVMMALLQDVCLSR